MRTPKKTPSRSVLEKTVPRREALKGLGALAVSLPVLGSVGCSDPKSGNQNTGAAGSTPNASFAGAPGTSSAGSSAAGSTATGSSTGGTGTTSTSAGSSGKSATGASGASGQASAGTNGGSAAGKAGAGGSSSAAGEGGAAGDPNGAGGDFVPVNFDDAASCTLTPTDPAGEGPFFVHEDEVMNDESLKRSDTREGKPGIELQLNLRVLDSDGKCMTGISGVEVYVWHTDATGFYSGFNNQNPDMPYSGAIERTVENMDRFCRGIQLTDKDGVVKFKTVYPGWYNGRAIHIHFVALRPGSGPSTMSYRSSQYMVFTTQMYFAETFSRMIHEHNAPYMSRASGSAYEMYVKPQNMTVNPTMKMQGNVAVGALNVITAASGSRR